MSKVKAVLFRILLRMFVEYCIAALPVQLRFRNSSVQENMHAIRMSKVQTALFGIPLRIFVECCIAALLLQPHFSKFMIIFLECFIEVSL